MRNTKAKAAETDVAYRILEEVILATGVSRMSILLVCYETLWTRASVITSGNTGDDNWGWKPRFFIIRYRIVGRSARSGSSRRESLCLLTAS